jgi:hypothetical protein
MLSDPVDGMFVWMDNRISIVKWHGKQPRTFPILFRSNIQTVNQSDSPDYNGIFNYRTDQGGPLCTEYSMQVRTG